MHRHSNGCGKPRVCEAIRYAEFFVRVRGVRMSPRHALNAEKKEGFLASLGMTCENKRDRTDVLNTKKAWRLTVQ